MKTPFLDRLIENLQNHNIANSIEAIIAGRSAGIPETRKELAEYEAIKKALLKKETKCSGCNKPLQSGLCGDCCSDLASGMF